MKDYAVPKLDIGDGDVFWSDGGQQVRVFGPTSSLRGPIAVMERVAMRILHLVDGHGGYAHEVDGRCERCKGLRLLRKHGPGAMLMKAEDPRVSAG